MDENTNPADVGSDNVNTSISMDDAVTRYAASSEPEKANADPQTEITPDTLEEEDDFALTEAEEETETEIAEAAIATDDMLVEIDGEKIPVKDLKAGRMMDRDYRQKTQAVAKERNEVREMGNSLKSVIETIGQFLQSKIPPMPAPELALTNFQQHYQQKTLHEAAQAELQQVLAGWANADEAVAQIDQAEFQSQLQAANEEIINQMPQLKDPKRFEAFNRSVEKAAKHFGFNEHEINSTVDPRIRIAMSLAEYGLRAKENAAKAKAKVQSAAPMLPQRTASANAAKAQAHSTAMKQFEQSRSMDDAIRALMTG